MLLSIALAAALGGAERRGTVPQVRPEVPDATLAQDGPPPDMPQGGGPRATSGGHLYDTVAVAEPDESGTNGVAVSVAGVAAGSFVELTELGGGRTILALVAAGQPPAGVVSLSPAAMQALGVSPGVGIRVRAALPSPQDQTALRTGTTAAPRIDAPEVLLRALRKRVPQSVIAVPPREQARAKPVKAIAIKPAPRVRGEATVRDGGPVARPARPPAPASRSGYIVQVAALSAQARADALAHVLGGRVIGGGGLYRVQLGPYADAAAAKRARDDAARRGYRDARIARIE